MVAAASSRPQQCGVVAKGEDGGKESKQQARRREARPQVGLGGWQADRHVHYPATPQPGLSRHSVSTSAAAIGRVQSTQGGAQACPSSSSISADEAGLPRRRLRQDRRQAHFSEPPPPPTPITSTTLRSTSNPVLLQPSPLRHTRLSFVVPLGWKECGWAEERTRGGGERRRRAAADGERRRLRVSDAAGLPHRDAWRPG